MVNVVYGICTNSLDRVAQNIIPRIGDRTLITLWNQTSICAAYNHIIDAVKDHSIDMLVLMHDDLELTDPMGEEKLLAAVNTPGVGLVGVAGARNVQSIAWWNYETVGHQLTDARLIDFGLRSGDVDALEGSIIALSPWAISNVQFDTRYDGFHGYDCDISFQVRARGRRVLVSDVDTHHHTSMGFKSTNSFNAWNAANSAFCEKWQLI